MKFSFAIMIYLILLNKKQKTLKFGCIYEVKTFSAAVIFAKIIGKYAADDSYYKAVLVRKTDIEKLIKHGVPYRKEENPDDCEFVVYPFQVLREIKDYERTRSKNTKSHRKRRRYSRPRATNDK